MRIEEPQIFFGAGSIERLASLGTQRSILVIDEKLKTMYGEALAKKVGASLISLPSGEQVKSQEGMSLLLEKLFLHQVDRETTLIAVGGGTLTDLCTFVASIYLRGIPLILIPTTLVGMVDAAIGGKGAINTQFGKNLVGTIYLPKAILMDPHFLKTLPEEELFNGRMEMVKLGLVWDPNLWEKEDLFRAITGKIQITKKDPLDRGLRRILNFGHTIGHALEKVSNYTLPHGKAVAIGCLAEAHLSMSLGFLSKRSFEEIVSFYAQFALFLPAGYTREKLWEAMAFDKKKKEGEVRFVLIDDIGHALAFDGAYCRAVSSLEAAKTLDLLEEKCGSFC